MIKKKQYLLSIVMPVYNVEKYVKSAINSIYNELSFTEDEIELIIVNDGSTDDSLNIIKETIKENNQSKISAKIISTKNQGLGAARNTGINNAKSNYVLFIDSDDILCKIPKNIKKLISENQTDLILFSAECFNDEYEKSCNEMSYQRNLEGSFNNSVNLIRELNTRNGLFPNAWAYFIKKEVWDKYGLKFKSCYHEDEEILFRLLLSMNSFYCSNAVIIKHRIRAESIMTSSTNIKHAEGKKTVLIELLRIVNTPCLSREIKNVINKKISGMMIGYLKDTTLTDAKKDVLLIIKSLYACKSIENWKYFILYLLPKKIYDIVIVINNKIKWAIK